MLDAHGNVTNPNAAGAVLEGLPYPWRPQRGPLLRLTMDKLPQLQSTPSLVLLCEGNQVDIQVHLPSIYPPFTLHLPSIYPPLPLHLPSIYPPLPLHLPFICPAFQEELIERYRNVVSEFSSTGLAFYYAPQRSQLALQVRRFVGIVDPTALVLVDMRGGLKYVCDDGGDGSLDESDIVAFIEGWGKKQIHPHLRSEPRPLLDRDPKHPAALRGVASSLEDVLRRAIFVIHPGPAPLWAKRLATALQASFMTR